jgi:hypothetical protein
MTIMASLLLVRGRPPRPPHLLTQARRWGLPIRLAACLAGLVVYVSQQSTESCGEPRGHNCVDVYCLVQYCCRIACAGHYRLVCDLFASFAVNGRPAQLLECTYKVPGEDTHNTQVSVHTVHTRTLPVFSGYDFV